MKLLITGAAGFVGRTTARMAHERGHDVLALVRRESDQARLPFLKPGQFVLGSLEFPEKLESALQGVDAVIHAAAVTSERRPDRELSIRINVTGTRKLYEAASRAGVGRWVQISSMSAHAGSTSVYGSTKFGADEFLRGLPEQSVPAWTILKPSLIYGPDDRGLVAKTLRLARKLPVLPVLGSGETLIRPIHVEDVARAALDVLECETAIGKTLMLGGPDEVTLNVFMENMCRKFGVHRRLFHLPLPMCQLIALVSGWFTQYPPITVDNVLGVREVPRVEIRQAVDCFGFEPEGLESGLNRTWQAMSQ